MNSVANAFLESGQQSLLDELYKGVCSAWNIGHDSDEHSTFNEVFWKTTLRFKGGDFVNLLSRSFKNAKIDLARRHMVRKKREVVIKNYVTDDQKEDTLQLLYLASDYDLEKAVISHFSKKKEADKLILIDFLLESAKIHLDSTMTAIIEEFPRHKTLNALGKALGLSRNAVDRKLRSLSNHYDGNRFGDIEDYLAV